MRARVLGRVQPFSHDACQRLPAHLIFSSTMTLVLIATCFPSNVGVHQHAAMVISQKSPRHCFLDSKWGLQAWGLEWEGFRQGTTARSPSGLNRAHCALTGHEQALTTHIAPALVSMPRVSPLC